MLEIKEYVDISKYSTLKIGGQFRYFAEISRVEDLPLFYAIAQGDGKYKNIPIFILGGGSNIVFSDGVLNVIALKMEIKEFSILNGSASNGENSNFIEIKVGAGENWDKTVEKTVEMNLAGLEALSAIPGTVGATPVQNVGAYGAEVKDAIVSVEVFDTKDGKIKNLSNKDCKFGYRDSIFKNDPPAGEKGRYTITAVVYRLQKVHPVLVEEGVSLLGGGDPKGNKPNHKGIVCDCVKIPNYPGVKKYFEEKGIENPSLKQIREAIIYIRGEKLPNPKEIPNVGSFFKNPIISKELFQKILKKPIFSRSRTSGKYGEIPHFDVGDDMVKIPAGWLIENAGLKGKSFGPISVYDKNALVLINNGEATKDDLMKAKNEIIKTVFQKFGITLEQEPENI